MGGAPGRNTRFEKTKFNLFEADTACLITNNLHNFLDRAAE
jgi:hypothetical protein